MQGRLTTTGARPLATDFDALVSALALRLPFDTQRKPSVSIVVPVFNALGITLQCLRSIAETPSAVLAEIIVVDDGSASEVSSILARIPNIEFIKNARNLGFIQSCNRGASIARGTYTHFLNNDTVVRERWLDESVALAESDPSIGAVGSKLLYPDGRLQEAGTILWRDGSGWQYGHSENPDDPRFDFVREVDYCSGASLLVRSDLLARLGGFDTRYAPAYYEDSDLAMAMRKAGYRVMYQPRSIVVHHEGASNGRDLTSGIKRFESINAPKFFEKWQRELSNHHQNDPDNVHLAARRLAGSRSLLVIDNDVPLEEQGRIAQQTLAVMHRLVAAGVRVVFYTDEFRRSQQTTELQRSRIEVLYDEPGRSPERRILDAFESTEAAWIRPAVEDPGRFVRWLESYPSVRIIDDPLVHFGVNPGRAPG